MPWTSSRLAGSRRCPPPPPGRPPAPAPPQAAPSLPSADNQDTPCIVTVKMWDFRDPTKWVPPATCAWPKTTPCRFCASVRVCLACLPRAHHHHHQQPACRGRHGSDSTPALRDCVPRCGSHHDFVGVWAVCVRAYVSRPADRLTPRCHPLPCGPPWPWPVPPPLVRELTRELLAIPKVVLCRQAKGSARGVGLQQPQS